MTRFSLAALAAALCLPAMGVADPVPAGLLLTGLGGETSTLSAADIAALPHQAVTLPLEGKSEPCDAVPLSALLAKVGAPQGKAMRGPELADIVVVTAADGYRVALGLAETDPLMRPTPSVLIADRCNGAALDAGEGPFRLVVLGEGRPARSARRVVSIKLERAP